MNPQTGGSSRTRALVHQDGKQYRPDDILAGRLIEQRPAPNLIEYTVGTLAPQPTRFADGYLLKLTTGGGRPSSPAFYPVRQPRILYNTGGEPLCRCIVGEIFPEYMLGIRA